MELADFRRIHARLIHKLWTQSDAMRWSVDETEFTSTLFGSTAANVALDAHPGEVEAYLESLRAEDLALACGCRRGDEGAWHHFVEHYRPAMYAAARAITRDESTARELADSLYSDLFGAGGGARRPLLDYFHGRSSLATWLRAVLTRRHIDAMRAAQHKRPLDQEAAAAIPDPHDDPPDPDRARLMTAMKHAVESALAALKPRDRLRLAMYYVQELKLVQIGRLMNEHESTASRKLERSRSRLKSEIESALARAGLSADEVALCYEYAVREWPFDLTAALTAEPDKKIAPDRSIQGRTLG